MVDLPLAESVLRIAAALAMVALAGWLLWINWRSIIHSTFAGLLVVQAAVALGPAFDTGSPAGFVGRWASLLLLLLLPLFMPLFYMSWQRSHCVAHIHGNVRVQMAILRFFRYVPIGVAVLYAWDATLYANPTQVGRLLDPEVAVGPLYAAAGLELVSYAVLALLFAREFEETKTPMHRNAYLFVALGFGLAASYEALARIVLTLAGPVPFVDLGAVRLASLFWSLLATLVVLATARGVFVLARSRLEPHHRPGARVVLVVLGAALLAALSLAPLARSDFPMAMRIHGLLSATLSLANPFLVTYAILRHHLFEIDVTLQRTVRRGTVAAVFLAVFFAVTEGAQELFSSHWGPLFGIGASAALVFAMAPLQRFADRFAHATVPEAKPIAQWSPEERAVFFREQVQVAWGDGNLNAKERLILNNLRERLGLSADEALRIETEALGDAGHSHPPAVAPTPS